MFVCCAFGEDTDSPLPSLMGRGFHTDARASKHDALYSLEKTLTDDQQRSSLPVIMAFSS
jgi:hypothetical protein